MTPPIDPYKLLQVDPEADPEIIVAAYRRLARRYHPDIAANDAAAAMMVALNGARDLLLDPARRAELDRQRGAVQGSPGPGETGRGVASPVHGAGAMSPVGSVDPVAARDRGPARSTDAGSAGPPPGNPSGSTLDFGRYAGWSLGEIARADIAYLEWLDRMSIGRRYRDEVDGLLRRAGRRGPARRVEEPRGLFRRR